jgi:hypothetical protein
MGVQDSDKTVQNLTDCPDKAQCAKRIQQAARIRLRQQFRQ